MNSTIFQLAPSNDRELVLTRLIDAPRARVFQAWTDPDLLEQWFAPKPWSTPHAELDVRPGGTTLVVMRSPEGDEFPNPGVYLEVVENERLVLTDAYTKAWEPSQKPFFTLVLTFEDEGGKPATPLARGTGQWLTASSTRRWAFMKAGDSAPTSSPHW